MRIPLLTGLMIALAGGSLDAQQARVVGQRVDTIAGGVIDTAYLIQVGSDTIIGITKSRSRRHLQTAAELKATREGAALDERVLQKCEAAVARYAAFREHSNQYVDALQAQLDDYEKLTGLLRKKRTGSWVSFDAGVGATADWNPAVMAGVGIHQLRLWGFLQEGNAGGIVGIHLPMF